MQFINFYSSFNRLAKINRFKTEPNFTPKKEVHQKTKKVVKNPSLSREESTDWQDATHASLTAIIKNEQGKD